MYGIFLRIFYFAIALSLAVPAYAEDEAPAQRSWKGTVSVKSLNVRGGPGEGYPIIAKLSRGDAVVAVAASGKWVRLLGVAEGEDEAWVYKPFVRLPKDFLAPAFGDAENAFLDWIAKRDDLDQFSVEARDHLAIIFKEAPEESEAEKVAEEIGCAYRKQLKVEDPVTVTVWTEKGPVAGWLAQATCP